MPRKEIKNITKNSEKIYNAIRSEMGNDFKGLFPQANGDLIDILGGLNQYPQHKNAFLENMVNKVGLQLVKNLLFTNPFKAFKKGVLLPNESVEEIFIGVANSYDYNFEHGVDNPFERVKSDVRANYHTVNLRKTFQTTITVPETELFMLSETGLYDMVDKIVQSLYSGYEILEWEQTLKMFADADKNNSFYKVTTVKPTDKQTTNDFVKKIKTYSYTMQYPSMDYNENKVLNTTKLQDQILIISSETMANIDVELLASAFNMEKADFLGHLVVVPGFYPSPDTKETLALLVDVDWFMIYDKLLTTESMYNPKKMYTNYFLHCWAIFSYSRFENAIKFEVA